MKTPKLFIFLSTLLGLILAVLIVFFILWQRSPLYQPMLLSNLLLYGFLIFTVIFIANFMFILAGISFARLPYLLLRPLHISLNITYPLLRAAGKFAGINKERIQGAYVEVHNLITRHSLQKTFKPAETLILLPHCLQPETCLNKITSDINNCTECGACIVARIKKLASLGYKIKVVPGGTMARAEIKKQRPKFIIAVACENDLSQGIMGVDKCPVLGVLNQRPNGPCFRTTFQFNELENLLNEYNLTPVPPQ
jgi:Uncharacterized conserved protein